MSVETQKDLETYKKEMQKLRDELKDKKKAIQFLQSTGIINKNGKLSEHFK